MAHVDNPKEATPEELAEKAKKPWRRCHYCNKGAHGEEAWNARRGTDLHKHETGMVRDEPQWYETGWVPITVRSCSMKQSTVSISTPTPHAQSTKPLQQAYFGCCGLSATSPVFGLHTGWGTCSAPITPPHVLTTGVTTGSPPCALTPTPALALTTSLGPWHPLRFIHTTGARRAPSCL